MKPERRGEGETVLLPYTSTSGFWEKDTVEKQARKQPFYSRGKAVPWRCGGNGNTTAVIPQYLKVKRVSVASWSITLGISTEQAPQ